MKVEMDELLDAADNQICHPHKNPRNLCDIFEEVIDLTDCQNNRSEAEYRYRLMQIAKLMVDAMTLGDMRFEGRMEMLDALNRNDFWKCPDCGWVKVTTIYHSSCSVCGRPVHKVNGIWKVY